MIWVFNQLFQKENNAFDVLMIKEKSYDSDSFDIITAWNVYCAKSVCLLSWTLNQLLNNLNIERVDTTDIISLNSVHYGVSNR